MVFKNKEWNNTQEIVVYSNYHPYWIDKEAGICNRQFFICMQGYSVGQWCGACGDVRTRTNCKTGLKGTS